MPVQNREHQGFDATPIREPLRRGRGEETVNDRGDLQTPSDSEDQGPMRCGMHLLYEHCHEAPPVIASRQHHSGVQAPLIAGLSSQATIMWFNLTP